MRDVQENIKTLNPLKFTVLLMCHKLTRNVSMHCDFSGFFKSLNYQECWKYFYGTLGDFIY